MTDRAKATGRHWMLVAILLLAFVLRAYRLGTGSLWYDETVSVYLAGKSLPALVEHTAGDIHPPGYYLLLHAWMRLAGLSDLAAAIPSLFFGVLLVALAYRLANQVFGYRAGLLSSFLVAISPYNLWYSQEVRMYTLGAVLGMVLLAAVVSLLTSSPGAPPAWSYLAVYVVCGALGLWVLYYYAFLLVAVNLLVGIWWLAGWRRVRVDWRWLGRWALAQGAVLLLYAPWIPIAWRQATNPPVPPWRTSIGLGDLVVQTWSALSLGQSVEPARVWPVLLLCAILFGLGLFSRMLYPRLKGKLEGDFLPWLLASYVLVPVLLIYLVSLITPLYHVRYAFTYSTPFYVVLGAGLAWLWGRWRLAFWLGLIVIVVFSGVSVYAYHTDVHYASDDHRAATAFLQERWRPGDAILVNAGYAYTALVTYWDGDPIAWRGRLVDDATGGHGETGRQGPVVVQSGTVDGDPSLGWGDPASDFYAMSRAETVGALARLFNDFDRVWVYRIYDTVTDPEGVVRNWLDEQGTRFEDRAFTGESQLRVQGFLTGRNPLSGMDQTFDATLTDGSLHLLAASGAGSEVEVGGALDLALVWQVQGAPANDAVLFAGLFDEAGQRWGQADERPLGSVYPPDAWPQGGVVRTPLRVGVRPGTPPGRYQLEVGWYRFVNGQSVWLPWASGERLALGQVDVVAPRDWSALLPPEAEQPVDVMMGEGLKFLGFTMPRLEAQPGDLLSVDLFWQAVGDAPEAGLIVLQLTDDAGDLWAEVASAPVQGRVAFARMQTGQAIRDPHKLALPADLVPGVYNLSLGRRRPDGSWVPIRRGLMPLGSPYPLATVRILGRSTNVTPPQVQYPTEAQFGDSIRLVGYDLVGYDLVGNELQLTLYWQSLAPMQTRYKIFAHLVGEGGPSDIRAQADLYPRLPTTAWLPGEYLADSVVLDLPADLPPGAYTLLIGFYDEASGMRLPVSGAGGEQLGDSLPLTTFHAGE